MNLVKGKRLFHVHRDRNYQLDGCWYRYECRCGARRTRQAYANMMGPVPAGYPDPRDRHGNALSDSGWRTQLSLIPWMQIATFS
jgi:hypothetical protein